MPVSSVRARQKSTPAVRAAMYRVLARLTAKPRLARFDLPVPVEPYQPERLWFTIGAGTVEGRAFVVEFVVVRRGCGRWRVDSASGTGV